MVNQLDVLREYIMLRLCDNIMEQLENHKRGEPFEELSHEQYAYTIIVKAIDMMQVQRIDSLVELISAEEKGAMKWDELIKVTDEATKRLIDEGLIIFNTEGNS